MAYQVQMLAGSDGVRLGPDHLLWLATAAGAAALGLSGEVGDLGVGKSADFVLVRAPEGSTLAAVLERYRVARGDAGGAVHAGPGGVDCRGAGGREGRLNAPSDGRRDGCLRRRGTARRGGVRRRRLEHARSSRRAGRRPAVADTLAVGVGVDRPDAGRAAGVGPGGVRPAASARAGKGVHDRALGADGGRAVAGAADVPIWVPARGRARARGRHRSAVLLQPAVQRDRGDRGLRCAPPRDGRGDSVHVGGLGAADRLSRGPGLRALAVRGVRGGAAGDDRPVRGGPRDRAAVRGLAGVVPPARGPAGFFRYVLRAARTWRSSRTPARRSMASARSTTCSRGSGSTSSTPVRRIWPPSPRPRRCFASSSPG